MKDFQSLKTTISGVVEGAEAVAEVKTNLSEREDTRRSLSRVGGFLKLLANLHKVEQFPFFFSCCSHLNFDARSFCHSDCSCCFCQ